MMTILMRTFGICRIFFSYSNNSHYEFIEYYPLFVAKYEHNNGYVFSNRSIGGIANHCNQWSTKSEIRIEKGQ